MKTSIFLVIFCLLIASVKAQDVFRFRKIQKISNSQGNLGKILNTNEQFGTGLYNIGDVNKDGVPDVAVGAPKDNDGGTQKGAVYILFLKKDGTVKSSQKISQTSGNLGSTFPKNDYQFGFSVSGLGDINGDGIRDIAVGAFNDDGKGSSRGAVWILFLDTTGKVKSTQKIGDGVGGFSAALNDNGGFGKSVTCLGDIDADGTTEIAVGHLGDNDGGTSTGAVFIISLKSGGTVNWYQKISYSQGGVTGLDPGDYFGCAVASMGDFDGDSIPDLAVGAWRDDDGGTDKGAVYVLMLNNNGTVKKQSKISASYGNLKDTLPLSSAFGNSISSGDLNGDGLTDLVVGANLDDDGGVDRGAFYILWMNKDATVNKSQKYSSTKGKLGIALKDGDNLGANSTYIGDLNQDGNPDIIVGAIKDDDGNSDAGALYSLFSTDKFDIGFNSFTTAPAVQCAGTSYTLSFRVKNYAPVTVTNIPFVVKFSGDSNGIFYDTIKTSLPSGSLYTYNFGKIDGKQGDTVKIVIYNTLKKDSIQTNDTLKGVLVFLTPVPNFKATNFCKGDSTLFTNTSLYQNSSDRYSWDFGDGVISSEKSPKHLFQKAGNFDVRLIVISSAGCSDTINKSIHIQTPPLVQFDFTSSCQGDTVFFNNKSSGSGNLKYTWSFGDGSYSTLASPSHFFKGTDTFEVRLSATDSSGCYAVISKNVIMHPLPIAKFNVSEGCEGDSFGFANTSTISSLENLNWYWDFGDGKTSTSRSPNHLFAQAGTFIVKLTVTSSAGCSSSFTKSLVVHPRPKVSFLASNVCLGTPSSFVNNSSISNDTINSYTWNFGDGNFSTLTTASHLYTSAGTYRVTLTASTKMGCNDSFVKTIKVFDLPKPLITLNGDTLVSTKAVTYQWFRDSAAISGATSRSHYPRYKGAYYVLVTDSNGCASMSPLVLVTNTDINVTDPYLKDLEVFPNPFSHILNLRYRLASSAQVEIALFDITGREIIQLFDGRQPAGEQKLQFNIYLANGLHEGLYILRFVANGNMQTRMIDARKMQIN